MKGMEMEEEEWLVVSLMLERVPRNHRRKRSHRFKLFKVQGYPLEEVWHKMSR